MKQFIFFLLLFVMMSCGSQSGGPQYDLSGYETENIGGGAQIAIFQDADGWFLAKGTLVNGSRTGSWLSYHEKSNRIKTLTSYVNGRRNGIQIQFNERGQIESLVEYKNDQIHGLSAKYKFGRPTEETNFKDGKMDGFFAIYDSQGKLQRKGELKNGEYHGKLQYFDESGNLTMEYEYNNGEKVSGGIVQKEEENQ